MMRESSKDNMADVTAAIFSHSQVQKKNALVIALIVSVVLRSVALYTDKVDDMFTYYTF